MARMPRRSRMVAAAGVASLLGPIALLASPASAVGDASFDAFANPGETVTVEFPYRAEQYEWVVPEGVTVITVELAAGAGASIVGDEGRRSPGGPGGSILAELTVEPGESLFVLIGAAGRFTGAPGDVVEGTGSAVAFANELVAVVGGGGSSFRCIGLDFCGSGGAGGYSRTSNSPDGLSGSWVDDELFALGLLSPGGGAGTSSAGTPGVRETVFVADSLVVSRDTDGSAPDTPEASARATNGLITLSPRGSAESNRDGRGGTGYFTGGTGSMSGIITGSAEIGLDVSAATAGGGGGSGYLADGVELLELRDNVGDGFATITYTVPEPDVVDTLEPELSLGAATVRAGEQLTLSGRGFEPDRELPVILNSDPVLLGTVTTDDEGAFSAELTIPESLPAGEHIITVGDASIPITVLPAEPGVDADDTARDGAPAALVADGEARELAATGADPLAASILGALAVALLAAGAAAVKTSRQPRPVRQPAPARRVAMPTR